MGEPSRRKTISAALRQSGLYGIVAWWKPLLSKRHYSQLGVCQHNPKGLWLWEKNILWSDETKIELFGLNAKSGRNLAPSLRWSMVVTASCCGDVFPVSGTGRLVRIEGRMNGEKNREILDENLLQSAQDLRLGRRFTFQQDNAPKHTTNAGEASEQVSMSSSGPARAQT